MSESTNFTPWDFLKLVKELNEHEGELKIKLASARATGQEGAAARPA